LEIMGDRPAASFLDAAEADDSPLASALFKIPLVRGVFLGPDYVTITKANVGEWKEITPMVGAAIADFMATGADPMPEGGDHKDTEILPDDDETTVKLKELISEMIRPEIQKDGGDLVFHGVEDGWVKLQLTGSCVGCPSSTETLQGGIDGLLKHYLPDLKGVVHVDG